MARVPHPLARPWLASALAAGAVLCSPAPLLAEAASEAAPGAPGSAVAGSAAAALALPGCRAALGLPAGEPAASLLARRPDLAALLAATPACRPAETALQRLDRLERELTASRERIAAQQALLAAETARQEALAADLGRLRRDLGAAPAPAPAASVAPESTPAVAYTPGRGFSLQAGGSTLQLRAEARLLGFSSSRYTFNPGQPLVVSPKDPAAVYDFSAQQSTVTAAFQGPAWGSWTPRGFALFTLQDNLLAEGYSFTPVVFHGSLSNGSTSVTAGQNFDVFAPRDPDNIPSGKLAATGNPGAYRPQLRLEHELRSGEGFAGTLQLAVSAPITTALPDSFDLDELPSEELVEDNGWPNVEGRLGLGFGAPSERAGGRRLRPFEVAVSGLVGQLRVLDDIRATAPLTLVSDRTTINVWGAAVDGQLALGRRFGLSGELYTGQGLGEYMAGIFQTYNRLSNEAVPTAGGWGQLYVYLAENLRLNLGYGIDNAQQPGRFGLERNSTAFANLLWDVNPWLQLGLEGHYKLTTYDSFGDKDAWIVISEVLFRL
jgi:hypothetical protein